MGHSVSMCGLNWEQVLKKSKCKKRVVVVNSVDADTMMNILTEIYACSLLQDYYVVLLSPSELDTSMKKILLMPKWAKRVTYIQGSGLKDEDLARARINEAQACFVLSDRTYMDKTVADYYTVMRSWAVKYFAPNVAQYVQVFRPENKLHVKFADFVVCEDEFKCALLANNCSCPGTSTLVTLLLHTSSEHEGQQSQEEWHRLYESCSRNEIYHIVLGGSRFFGEYEGKSFTYASFHSYRKFGVALVGVRPTQLPKFYEDTILLNPGHRHVMKKDDTCFYISVLKDENSSSLTEANILPTSEITNSNLNILQDVTDESRDVASLGDELEDDEPCRSPNEKIVIVKGFPPGSPYIGVSPTLCYLLKEKKPLCCLKLAQMCEHCSYRNARDYQWQNKTIILAADYASNGIYNFIIPLRAHFRTKTSLNPIILLLERSPDIAFLDAISYFPLVYWMLGTIDCLDDLLRAGITLAETVVVVNKEVCDAIPDYYTIVDVQTMTKFFPDTKIITELLQFSNMRFMQFRLLDKHTLALPVMEKGEKGRCSSTSFFQLPFAAGNVFSANMLNPLLYKAFVNNYVITFVRLLLGIDQAPGSGFLTSMKITTNDEWPQTYGLLYQTLCSTTREIPIGIYRTQDTSLSYSTNTADEAKDNHEELIERAEIANLVKSRMESLNLPTVDYNEDINEKKNCFSYVIVNPSPDLKLEEGDIIYLIRPSPLTT